MIRIDAKDRPIKSLYNSSTSNLDLADECWGALWDISYTDYVNKFFKYVQHYKNQIKKTQGLIKWNYGEFSHRRIDMHELQSNIGVLNRELGYNIGEKNRIIQRYEDIVSRNFNDQTVYDDKLKRNIEAESTAHRLDMVTNDGMTQLALLVTNESNEYFSYYAYGTGTTPAALTDLILEAEQGRVNIDGGAGFHSGSGTSIKHAGLFSQAFPSAEVTENGAFTQPDTNSGVMLFRAVFPPSQALHHVFNANFFTIAHIIYQTSV